MRTTLQDKRFGELREGVWLRPDNLDVELTAEVLERVRVMHARDDEPAELAAQLWDLPGWVRIGHRLLDEMASAADIPGRFPGRGGMVRHLLTDPVLPDELLPADWPGAALRQAYTTSPRNWSRGDDDVRTDGGDMTMAGCGSSAAAR